MAARDLALIELKERLMAKKRRKLRGAAKPNNREPTAEQPSTASPSTAQLRTGDLHTDIPALTDGALVGPKGATRYVPADIARIVFERDNYRCQFVGIGGHTCGSTRDSHLHHIISWARGGTTTPGNLTIYCRCHNLYQGELDFGPRERAA